MTQLTNWEGVTSGPVRAGTSPREGKLPKEQLLSLRWSGCRDLSVVQVMMSSKSLNIVLAAADTVRPHIQRWGDFVCQVIRTWRSSQTRHLSKLGTEARSRRPVGIVMRPVEFGG